MIRILFLLAIAVAIWWLFRAFFRAQVKPPGPPPATTALGEDMIACARCGVNLPRSEAREEDGRLVCHGNPSCH